MKTCRLLCVDDEPSVLNAIRRELRTAPVEATYCTDPRKALELLSFSEFEVILSDYRMPVMNGVDFLIESRTLAPNSMRMILSGQADMDAVLRSINEAGVVHFLTKPWSTRQLLDCVLTAASERDRRESEARAAGSYRDLESRELRRQRELAKIESAEPGISSVNFDSDGAIKLY